MIIRHTKPQQQSPPLPTKHRGTPTSSRTPARTNHARAGDKGTKRPMIDAERQGPPSWKEQLHQSAHYPRTGPVTAAAEASSRRPRVHRVTNQLKIPGRLLSPQAELGLPGKAALHSTDNSAQLSPGPVVSSVAYVGSGFVKLWLGRWLPAQCRPLCWCAAGGYGSVKLVPWHIRAIRHWCWFGVWRAPQAAAVECGGSVYQCAVICSVRWAVTESVAYLD